MHRVGFAALPGCLCVLVFSSVLLAGPFEGHCTARSVSPTGQVHSETPAGTPFGLPSTTPTEFPPSWSQADDRPYWRTNLFRRFLGDQKFLLTTWWPAESRRYTFSFPLIGAVAGASGSFGEFDRSWQRSAEEWTEGTRRDVAEAISRLGSSESALVLLGSTYLISRWAGNERMQRASSLSAEALLSTAVYSTLLKRLTRRTRPSQSGTGEFFVFRGGQGQSTSSFPSGHAMGAFAVAGVFSREFRDKRWVRWVAYGTAGLIAFSRVSLGRHFPTDVIAGAVIGDSVGRMVVHRSGGEASSIGRFRLAPLYEPRNNGYGLTYRHAWN